MDESSSQPLPPGRRSLISIGVMLATLMQVLDQTIANVALPHMQAALGANQETVAWVLTSYIVAAAIATPITGWLVGRLGTRKLFTVSAVGFIVASMACGFAGSLTEMVVFRSLQGLFGAFLVPLAQTVMYTIYPREKHAQAMTLWSMGVMVGPVMGPVIGGWLTDAFDWRYVFFINLPFGIVALSLIALMPEGGKEERRFDLTGFILLGLALSAFQLMLDRGSQLDWFDSWEIRIEAGVALAATWMFVIHLMNARDPLVRLALFTDRNFAIALVFLIITSAVMVAGSALLAPMMQRLMGYDATQAGLATMPRGLGAMVSMLVAGKLIKYVDGRYLIAFGLTVTSLSLWQMSGFTLDMDQRPVIISGFVQGLGTGFIMLPLNLLAFSTLAEKLRADASAIYSLARSLGGSVAISLATALLAHNIQVSHSDMTVHITALTLPWLDTPIVQQLGEQGLSVLQMLDTEINRQAMMLAYLDDFYIMFWITLIVIPLILFMRKPRQVGDVSEAMSMAD